MIPLTLVQHLCKERLGVSVRSFQLYTKQGKIPKPYKIWKNCYYTSKQFSFLLKQIYNIKLKKSV